MDKIAFYVRNTADLQRAQVAERIEALTTRTGMKEAAILGRLLLVALPIVEDDPSALLVPAPTIPTKKRPAAKPRRKRE